MTPKEMAAERDEKIIEPLRKAFDEEEDGLSYTDLQQQSGLTVESFNAAENTY